MLVFQYIGRARLNMLAVHRHGRGMRLSACLVCTMCVVAIVVCVTSDGLFWPKQLPTRRQDGGVI